MALSLFIIANLMDLKFTRISCIREFHVYILISYLATHNTLQMFLKLQYQGLESKFSNGLGFLPNINSYGLMFPKLGVLNVLYANIAKGKYFGHI